MDILKTHSSILFRAFKYTVYVLLTINIVIFFREEHLASAATHLSGVTWKNVVEVYPATVDTFFWVILLLLFELETAVIPDEKLRGSLKWVLMSIRTVCYFFIVYAFFGYWNNYFLFTRIESFSVPDLCAFVGLDYQYVLDIDEYPPIDSSICVAMNSEPFFRLIGTEAGGTNIIGTPAAIDAALKLAIVDIINSGDWLVVVVLLEVEVFLQLYNRLTQGVLRVMKGTKSLLYSVLFACAIYWGWKGDFVDFWDAFLWLVAFIFIEMNIFEWNEETREAASAAVSAKS